MNWISQHVLKNHLIAALLVVALAWLLFEIKEILLSLFLAFILMSGLLPFADGLHRRKVPRILAVAITYFSALFLVILLIVPLVPFFIAQVQLLFAKLPLFVNQAATLFGFEVDASSIHQFITDEFATIGRSAYSVTTKVFSGLFSTLTILVVTFYLLLDKQRVQKGIASVFPKQTQEKVHTIVMHVEEKLGAWLRGQIVLSLFIGVLTWVVLTVLGLEFALSLAVLAGILEIVPTLGPILSAIPAIIVAISVSPTLALTVVFAYLAIQAVENNILVPKIMEKAVGLHPILIIVGVMAGARLLGVVGALLSIPFLSMVLIVWKNLSAK